MGRYWLDPKLFLPLLFLIAFFGFILIGKSLDLEERNLQSKISKGKSRRRIFKNDFVESDEIIVQINLLVKQYKSGMVPELLPELKPMKDIQPNKDPWNSVEISPTTAAVTSHPKKSRKSLYKSPQKTKSETKKSLSTRSYLNVHYWESFCGSRIEDLKRNIHFPYYPSEKGNITKFYIQRYETGYGQRIFGYLHPPETGNFTFAVSCDDNCEVWLSTDNDPEHISKIAHIGTFEEPANTKIADFQAFPSQISKSVHLNKNTKYYIEVLHKQGAYRDHVLLTWLAPSWSRIKTIQSEDISSYIDVNETIADVNDYKAYIPVTKACLGLRENLNSTVYHFNREQHLFTAYDYREDFFKLQSVDMNDFTGLLPLKSYQPSYVLKFKPDRYEGVNLMHESAVYPDDYTELSHMVSYEACHHPRYWDSHFKYFPGYEEEPDEADEEGDNSYTKGREIRKPLRKSPSSPLHVTLPIVILRKNLTDKEVVEKPAAVFHEKFKKRLNEYRKSNSKDSANTFKLRKLMAIDDDDDEVKNNELRGKKNKMQNGREKENGVSILQRLKGVRERFQRDQADQSYSRDDNKDSKLRSYSRDNNKDMRVYSRDENKDSKSYSRNTDTDSSPYSRDAYRSNRYQRNWGYNRRHRKETLQVFRNKVFFKDGELVRNNTSKPIDMKALLIYYYPLFGTSTYYLVQKPARSSLWRYKISLSKCRTDGNLPLNAEVVVGIVQKYMQAVRAKHGSKYTLQKIVNVEENHDVVEGDRYLIEIELNVKGIESPRRLSTYIYRESITDDLFEPEGFAWDPQATVHVIVPVKDQGRWVQNFIDNMEKVYLETGDTKLNVIIVDFNSSDINIERSLKNSKLKRYNLIQLTGAFQRALGIQAGADIVKNDADIIFTCDLHLDIPALLIDTIRKHTIQKKLSFAPMVHRLSCGYTPDLPYGLWETEGYGLFSITKYDFDRIGGMNTKEFKTKWGGEDWEFLDRALGNGLEVERLRVPNFFHHYHSKRKMWKHSSPTTTSTTPSMTSTTTTMTSTNSETTARSY